MLNKEKYAKEILEIACDGYSVAITDGKPRPCDGMRCTSCDFGNTISSCRSKMKEWADSEYIEPSVDWSKVPIDTPILVRVSTGDPWTHRCFAGLHDGCVCAWDNGTTSWSTWSQESGYSPWEYAKLAESEE